ncbi:AAA family ATPase [Flavobacterium sp. CHNK8]|uniref:UvrD-helicase domain-containing protein n=1 Tax=Flavobacterium sp. CHNK8 TaxID=2871165 RepID=UPI001C8EE426|nr:UvrD-helicase domain-containing protein [Flavobacterium sp. CHNK8]QZK89996.1 AAA family ATPase [Flavobacterium sp. CHNK8]
MINYKEFISNEKSMLIAPAGYGKTHTIVECLKHTQAKGRQLILTHTHAGVAAIKEKIKREGISSSSYSIETISSFAQKYVLSFYIGTEIPEQENSKNYYPFIIEKSITLLKIKPIREIISNTYNGLFVDEYQDCTIKQHELILILSELLPTRILGDFLQGIFGFNGESLVNLESKTEMKAFQKSYYELDQPQRWLNGNNALLGENLKDIRNSLIQKEEIDLSKYPSIETKLIKEFDLYDFKKDYNRQIRNLLDEKDLLILHPDSTSINPRLKFIKLFNNRITLIESIDDKTFYKTSKDADSITKENIYQYLISISYELFNKSGLDNWFNEKGFKRKAKEIDKILISQIMNKINSLDEKISFSLLSEILKDIKELSGIKCYRKELFSSFCTALEDAEYSNMSVLEAMTKKRNLTRRVGRKIYGKSIGTTLLTKGLEFDTVVILNAHKFECSKHLYVALTRASKRLIIFTESKTLMPY